LYAGEPQSTQGETNYKDPRVIHRRPGVVVVKAIRRPAVDNSWTSVHGVQKTALSVQFAKGLDNFLLIEG
jgi:hypothetical protein